MVVNGFTYSVVPAPRWNYRKDTPLFGIAHKFEYDFTWKCGNHGRPGKQKTSAQGAGECMPDPACKECTASLKRVSKFHAYLQQELI